MTFTLAERPDLVAASPINAIPSIPISSSSRQLLIHQLGKGSFAFRHLETPLLYFSISSQALSLSSQDRLSISKECRHNFGSTAYRATEKTSEHTRP